MYKLQWFIAIACYSKEGLSSKVRLLRALRIVLDCNTSRVVHTNHSRSGVVRTRGMNAWTRMHLTGTC